MANGFLVLPVDLARGDVLAVGRGRLWPTRRSRHGRASESVGGDPDRAAFWAGLTEHQSSPRVREPLAVAGGGCQCPVDVPGTLPGEGVLHRRARQRCSEVSTGQFPCGRVVCTTSLALCGGEDRRRKSRPVASGTARV